jgi:tetratricopeptide (TPR) repeat protein
MRPLALFLCSLLIAAGVAAQDAASQRRWRAPADLVTDARIDRVERWLKAVARHEPGRVDLEAIDVGAWSQHDLQSLWIDVDVLVKLMRHPGSGGFTITPPGQHTPQEIRYTKAQLHRLGVLACAAVSIVADRHCIESKAATDLDAELLRVSSLVSDARAGGDGDNYVLRRGALLHSDVAMLVAARTAVEPVSTAATLGPKRFRMELSDGRQTDFGQAAVHWEIARMVLDHVKPGTINAPASGHDEMVRQWYRATATWMQAVEEHDTEHLDHGRAMFPDDPDLMFLCGALHEAYAAPRIQTAVRSAVLPDGVSFVLASAAAELRQAERCFRSAVEIRPGHVEARLRLGRVLGLLGRHAEARQELRQAAGSADEGVLRYYGELFLGAEEEALGHDDAAFDAYQRTAALYPDAQSPWLALSSLGRRRGDRTAALRALQHLFELPSTRLDTDDPWWIYHVAQARNVDELLETLRRPFLSEPKR